MAARPTPFGLFAGNTVGTLGETTQLELAPRDGYRRYTRLDGDYLSDLTDALAADPRDPRAAASTAPTRACARSPAGCATRCAARARAAATRWSASSRPTTWSPRSSARARGARPAELAPRAVRADDEVTRDEADEFIDELIDSQVLVSELAPPVTGPEAVDDVIAQLAADRATSPPPQDAARALRAIRATLGELDRAIGNPPARYRGAAEALAALPAKVEIPRLFQVDLVPAGARVELGRDVLDELVRAIDAAAPARRGRAAATS